MERLEWIELDQNGGRKYRNGGFEIAEWTYGYTEMNIINHTNAGIDVWKFLFTFYILFLHTLLCNWLIG